MAKITVEEAGEYTLLPSDSIIQVKIRECSIREVNTNGRSWEKLEITFEITGVQATGDGSPVSAYDKVIGTVCWGSVPFRLTESPENKLKQWAEAILGLELGLGFELDTDFFIGRTVRAVTSQYTKRNGYKAHQVDSLLPNAVKPTPSEVSQATSSIQQSIQNQQAVTVPAASPQGWDQEPPF